MTFSIYFTRQNDGRGSMNETRDKKSQTLAIFSVISVVEFVHSCCLFLSALLALLFHMKWHIKKIICFFSVRSPYFLTYFLFSPSTCPISTTNNRNKEKLLPNEKKKREKKIEVKRDEMEQE